MLILFPFCLGRLAAADAIIFSMCDFRARYTSQLVLLAKWPWPQLAHFKSFWSSGTSFLGDPWRILNISGWRDNCLQRDPILDIYDIGLFFGYL
jgi:hypothetical protein